MGQLGNIGYGLYNINGVVFIVHPTGCKIFKRRNAAGSFLDSVIEDAIDDDLFVDYKINRGLDEGSDN